MMFCTVGFGQKRPWSDPACCLFYICFIEVTAYMLPCVHLLIMSCQSSLLICVFIVILTFHSTKFHSAVQGLLCGLTDSKNSLWTLTLARSVVVTALPLRSGLAWSPVMTSCTCTTGRTRSARSWGASTERTCPSASRAATTHSSSPSAATPRSAATDSSCSTQVRHSMHSRTQNRDTTRPNYRWTQDTATGGHRTGTLQVQTTESTQVIMAGRHIQ